MSDTEKSKKISDLPNADKAVIFNVQETGYYRVNYDKQNWELIIKQLNEDHTKIHVINRAQIIDDAINLARSGIIFCECISKIIFIHQNLWCSHFQKNKKCYLPCMRVIYDRDKEQKIKHFEFAAFLNNKLQEGKFK